MVNNDMVSRLEQELPHMQRAALWQLLEEVIALDPPPTTIKRAAEKVVYQLADYAQQDPPKTADDVLKFFDGQITLVANIIAELIPSIKELR